MKFYIGNRIVCLLCALMLGAVSATAQTPLTYYRSIDDLPAFDDYDITKRTYKYFEGDVIYPFGYGLSYTTFNYSGLKVEDKGDVIDVSFTLKNTVSREDLRYWSDSKGGFVTFGGIPEIFVGSSSKDIRLTSD